MAYTPAEKAKELVEKFKPYFPLMIQKQKTNPDAKQCALIAVDEIVDEYKNDLSLMGDSLIRKGKINFWQQVKEEIKIL